MARLGESGGGASMSEQVVDQIGKGFLQSVVVGERMQMLGGRGRGGR